MAKGSNKREPEHTIQRMILTDNAMATHYRKQEQQYLGDLKAMELWASEGFMSHEDTNHDISDAGLR